MQMPLFHAPPARATAPNSPPPPPPKNLVKSSSYKLFRPSRRGSAGGPAFLCLALCLLLPAVANANICSRTTQVQTAIIALVSGKTACADITNTDLAGITGTLTVSDDLTLTALQTGDFAGLTNLTTLNLDGNGLTGLPANIFDPLTSLTLLDLNNNSLSSLPTGVFDKTTSLTYLYLHDNRLSSLPTGVFDKTTSLVYLYLHNNSLSSLPANIFDSLTSLTILNLYDNSLSGLPANIFDSLTSLTTLNLYNNNLSSLPANVFDSLTSLTYLNLDNNSLTSLPTGVFDNTTGLQHLRLHVNNLSSLPANVFDSLTGLTILHLNDNNLSSLPAGIFDKTTSLYVLDLNDNRLGSLPTGVFDKTTNLAYLYLKNNNLSSLPTGVFAKTPGLVYLYLYNNNLGSLPAGVFDGLTSLTRLYLHDNNLSSLPANVFDSLTSLTELNLYFNSLTSLPDDIFDTLTSLLRLRLQGNNLSSLPDDIFDSLTSLLQLSLYSNSLSSLPDDIFDSLTSLTTLDLYNNGLNSLPAGVFDSLTGLERLYLSSNNLSSLPANVFDSLTGLKRLWLSNNNLSSLPAGVLNPLTSLEQLYLHNNRLSGTIPALSTTLQRLHLAGNPITGGLSNLSTLSNLSILSLCETSLTTSATLPAALETRRTAGTLTVFSCLDIEDATATEGTALSFSVEHSTWPVRGAASAQTLTVGYTTADGTATSADYTGTTTGRLTIPANTDTTKWTKSATISVATTDDTSIEPDETFTVTLANVINVIEVRRTATGTITDDDSPPSQATLTVTVPQAETVTLTYAVDDDGGSPLTGWEYRYLSTVWPWTPPNDNTVWRSIPNSAHGQANAASYTVEDLTAYGAKYWFQVRAKNKNGAGAASDRSPEVDPRTVPGAPTSPSSEAGNGFIILRWTGGGDGGSTISTWEYKQTSDSAWTSISYLTPQRDRGRYSYAVKGLQNGTAYQFEVRAVNAKGAGPSTTFPSRTPDSTSTVSPPDQGGNDNNTGNGTGTGTGTSGGTGGGTDTTNDQHGNDPATATAIATGSNTPGQINASTDVDYFTLTVPQAGLLVVETTGSTDTQGRLTTPDGQVLAQADGGGAQQNFQVTRRVAAGTYLVAVSGTGTGSYRLEVDLLVGFVDNPQPGSAQSGVGVVSGWVCEAETVEIELDGVPQQAAYGTERTDTEPYCGDTNNGFGLLWNWNLLGDGEHTVRVVVDGIVFATLPVTVTTLGLDTDFPTGLTGETTLVDFPTDGESVRLVWQQAQQNFALAEGPVTRQGSTRDPNWAFLENPRPGSYQSGISVLSGWVCEAEEVVLEIDGTHRLIAAYGTERTDTEEKCGDTNNGFGLLWNWNLFGPGPHTVRLLVDGEEWATAAFTITTLGAEMVQGLTHTAEVADFPRSGQVVTVEWQEAKQNFVITGVEEEVP